MSSKSFFVNALTFSRVPLIVAWLVLAIAQELNGGIWLGIVATVMMFFSGITDLFDGMLARKWSVVSKLGKMADPLMDKIFYVIAFPALMWILGHQHDNHFHSAVMLTFTILYILRDLWVTFMRSIASSYGADVSAMWLGKIRTALSFPTAGWIYVYLAYHSFDALSVLEPYWLWSCYLIEGVMIILNTFSFVSYTISYWPYLKKSMTHV